LIPDNYKIITSDHPYYKPIADIIEEHKQSLSSGEIAILIIDFLKAERTNTDTK
jgi:hypothetical protein